MKAVFTFDEHTDALYKALKPEQQDHERSTTTMELTDDVLKIIIEATDVVALRASVNGMTELITAAHKVMQ